MLQAPSHLSRVCGHRHIKKFWLMQTLKDSEVCESKTSLSFPPSSTPHAVNRASVIGLDSSSKHFPSVTHGYDADTGMHLKHSSFSRVDTLCPSLSLCKISHPHSSGSTGGQRDQEDRPSTLSPCYYPLNVALEVEGKYHLQITLKKADPADSLDSDSLSRSKDSHSTLEDGHSHIQPSRAEHKLREWPSKSRFPVSATASGYVLEMEKCRAFGSTSRYSDIEQHQTLNSGFKSCSRCGTTKTPMWRCGPQGPKSLCNACGIRFKKQRSSPAQNEPHLNVMSPSAALNSPQSLARTLKRKHSTVLQAGEYSRPQETCLKSVVLDTTLREEKRSKWHQGIVARKEQGEFKEVERDSSNIWNIRAAPASFKKIYGCFPIRSKFKKLVPMDKHHRLSNVFAIDEEEAAVLLMHLSSGLVY